MGGHSAFSGSLYLWQVSSFFEKERFLIFFERQNDGEKGRERALPSATSFSKWLPPSGLGRLKAGAWRWACCPGLSRPLGQPLLLARCGSSKDTGPEPELCYASQPLDWHSSETLYFLSDALWGFWNLLCKR